MIRNRGRLRVAAAAIVGAVVALIAVPNAAFGHDPSTYYLTKWPAASSVSYGLNMGFPTGQIRSSQAAAKNAWNDASFDTAEPDFWWSLVDDLYYGNAQSPCGIEGINTGALFWNNLDYIGSGVLGATRTCGSAYLLNFTIAFDSAGTNWYFGTGVPASNQWDFISIATHEFGHAFGMNGPLATGNHFYESDPICPESTARETMCPGWIGAAGTVFLRSLGTHDVDTFKAAC